MGHFIWNGGGGVEKKTFTAHFQCEKRLIVQIYNILMENSKNQEILSI